jgi:hypothetical protein
MRRVVASAFFSSVIGGRFGEGGTQRLKERNGQDSLLSYRKEEFVVQMPRVHQSTKRICTYPAFVRVETCKCQIEQYSYM